MKKLLILVIAFLLFSSTAQATLIDNLDGTVTQIRDEATYGDGSTLTWLKDANTSGSSMTWDDANTWANNLVFGGYDDWRLPTTVDGTFVWGVDGTTTAGYNIISSEMGYLYYQSLGNLGAYDTSGVFPQPGWDEIVKNTFPFDNLQLNPGYYWSSTENISRNPQGDYAWLLRFRHGAQDSDFKWLDGHAWAVRGTPSSSDPNPRTRNHCATWYRLSGACWCRSKT